MRDKIGHLGVPKQMPKHKHRKRSATASKPLNMLRGALGQKNATRLRIALEYCKEHLPVDSFEYAYLLATSSAQFGTAFPAGRKVGTTSRLNYEKPTTVCTLQREFSWAAVSCGFSKHILNSFFPLREKFFNDLLHGNYIAALATLETIDSECGKSLWAIENRILTLSLTGGFEQQKKYSKKLGTDNPRTNLAFYANYISERNEDRVAYTAFAERVESRLATWDITQDHRDEIRFRLLDRIASKETAFAGVLARQAANSPIDLYETLLTLLRRAKEKLNPERRLFERAFTYLGELSDWRILRTKRYLLGGQEVELADIGQRLHVTQFLTGEYVNCLESLIARLDATPGDVEASAFLAKTCSILGRPLPTLKWPANVTAEQIFQLLVGGSTSESAADSLKKLALSLRHSNVSAYIFTLLEERTFKGINKRAAIQLAASIYLDGANVRLALRDQIDLSATNFDAEWWYERIASGNSTSALPVTLKLSEESRALAGLYGAISRGDTRTALELGDELGKSPHLLFRAEASYLIPTILAQDLQVEKAIKASVNVYLERPELLPFTPLLQILKTRGYRELKGMREEPFLAIAFQVYSDTVDASEKEVALKVAWKNFLFAEGITRPSQLTILEIQPDFKARLHFLHQVCTQQTMELGGAFQSQLELDRERLQICINLATIDPIRRIMYDAEIIDLTRRINLEEGVTFLESSRVYVDEPGVLAWAKRNLESEFLRYLDFNRAGLFKSIRELEDALRIILAKQKNKASAIRSYLDIYDLSAEGLLESIIKQTADAFLSLPRYGLDAFLSSRIRHGSFVGYLRGPLEQKNLITKKDGVTRKYQDNNTLLDRWRIEANESRRQANVHLARFSEQVDSILDDAVARHLHVRGKLRPEGKIGFGTLADSGDVQFKRWTITAKSSLDSDSTFEELIAFCFTSMFWPSVRISLDQLQIYLRGEFRSKFTDALEDLSNALANSMHESKRSLMLADIHHCRSDLQAALDRVALWFAAHGPESSSLSLSLRDAIEVGLVATKNARPHFNPVVSWDIGKEADVRVAPNLIRHINEISFLIFENASKHSGFEEIANSPYDQQGISISASVVAEGIQLIVRSEISHEKDLRDVHLGIEAAKQKIENQEFEGITQANKGTGLVRLAMNAGSHEAAGKPGIKNNSVDFGLTDNRMFYVRLILGQYLLETATEETANAANPDR
ncbi:MAG: hypothetical protein JSR41_05635 [Proteobacteria bacterium]|nr:hypothetical protein [Pseudomonadota bacterium]